MQRQRKRDPGRRIEGEGEGICDPDTGGSLQSKMMSISDRRTNENERYFSR